MQALTPMPPPGERKPQQVPKASRLRVDKQAHRLPSPPSGLPVRRAQRALRRPLPPVDPKARPGLNRLVPVGPKALRKLNQQGPAASLARRAQQVVQLPLRVAARPAPKQKATVSKLAIPSPDSGVQAQQC